MKKNSNNEMSFPDTITSTFDYQQNNFWRCRYTSTGSKSLHYKILLPLSVKPINVKAKAIKGLDNLYTIGCYQTVTNHELPFLEIVVSYEFIKMDIDASEWLNYTVQLLGEEIIHRKDYYSVSGEYSDILTKNNFDGEVIISRIRVFKNYDFELKGANFILVKASCQQKDYSTQAETLLYCVKFFTLINDSKWHLAEELKSINIDSPAHNSFYHPASWQYDTRANTLKFSYHSISLKKNGKLLGCIDSYFLRHDTKISKEQFCKLIVSNLNKNYHSEVKKLLLTESKNNFNENIMELWSGEHRIIDAENREYTLLVFFGKLTEEFFYMIGTFVPKEQNFKLWAAGKRAIDIILNSLNNHELVYEDQFYIK